MNFKQNLNYIPLARYLLTIQGLFVWNYSWWNYGRIPTWRFGHVSRAQERIPHKRIVLCVGSLPLMRGALPRNVTCERQENLQNTAELDVKVDFLLKQKLESLQSIMFLLLFDAEREKKPSAPDVFPQIPGSCRCALIGVPCRLRMLGISALLSGGMWQHSYVVQQHATHPVATFL